MSIILPLTKDLIGRDEKTSRSFAEIFSSIAKPVEVDFHSIDRSSLQWSFGVVTLNGEHIDGTLTTNFGEKYVSNDPNGLGKVNSHEEEEEEESMRHPTRIKGTVD